MTRQYLIPGIGDISESGSRQYLIPGSADVKETQSSAATTTLIARRRTWANKPPLGTPIDRSHPFSQGLARQFLFNEAGGAILNDGAAGSGLTTSNLPAWGMGNYGPKLAYNGTNQQATGLDNNLPSGTSPVTIAVLFRTTSSSSNMCLLGYGNTAANNQNFHVMASAGALKIGAVNGDLAGSATVNDGKYHVGIGVFAGGNLYSYVDGVPDLAPTARANSTVLVGSGGLYSGKLGTLAIWTDADLAGGWIWNRAFSDADARQFTQSLFANLARRPLLGGSLATGTAGTAAISESADTASATGTELFTGTATPSESADTANASGSALTGVSGSASPSESADTASATGIETFTGSSAITEGVDTATSSGSELFTGTSAISEAADTANASGTAGTGTIGSAAVNETADTASASGSETFSGTSAISEAADAITATGSEIFSGSSAIAEGSDAASASGLETFSGSATPSETADTATASGTSSNNATGTAAISEANDAASGSGTLRFLGSAGITEAADVATATGFGSGVSTPAARIYLVAAQNRTYAVAAETRTYRVAA